MRAVLLASLVVSMLAAVPPSALQGQGGKMPKRPKLEAGADTNFAPAYYEYGVSMIERDPERAAAALTASRACRAASPLLRPSLPCPVP